jgi:hypothetical protein
MWIYTLPISLLLTLALAYEPDHMSQLPDCPQFPYNTFSGYLEVSDVKSLHYVFVESQTNPAKDPLVFYFDGGPGCSSLNAFFS